MRTLTRLWLGLSALWIVLIFGWLSFTPPGDHYMAAIFPVFGLGPVVLSGALLAIFSWAIKRARD